MNYGATDWVAEKLAESQGFEIVGRTPEGFLIVSAKGAPHFLLAVLGVRGVIGAADVEPLFSGANKPQFVVNVPSKTLWSGAAIEKIHAASAAFGTLGKV